MNDSRIIPPGSVLPPLRPSGEAAAVPAERPSPDEPRSDPARPTNSKHSTKPVRASFRKGHQIAKSAQRFYTINDFVDVSMRGLTGAAAKVWIVLWRDTKTNGLAKTAISDLARRMGCSPTTAKRAVRELKAAGLIVVTVVGGLGRGANVYQVVGYAGPVESESRGPPVIP